MRDLGREGTARTRALAPAGDAPADVGRPLPGALALRLAQSTGRPVDRVRVHEQPHPELAGAAAGAAGHDVYVPPGSPGRGTLLGDALLAHEVAHTLQPPVAGSAHPEAEQEATATAVLATVSPRPRPAPVRHSRGLGLQRCSATSVPQDLAALPPAGKAALIQRAIAEDQYNRNKVVVDTFAAAAARGEFTAVTDELDMPAVLGQLDSWTAVRVGTLGPVVSGADQLARARKAIIWQAVDDYGLERAEVITLWIFDSTQDDQILDVMQLLAADRQLGSSIGRMPTVQERLRARGIRADAVQDRGFKATDLARGAWGAITDFFGSAPIAKDTRGGEYLNRTMEMPEPYAGALGEIDKAEVEKALTPGPGAIVLGAADEITFGMVSGVYGVVSSVRRGMGHLFRGEWEEAVRTLLIPALLVGTAVGLRLRARGAIAAEASAAGRVLTFDEALARLEPESAAALRKLIAEVGEARIQLVAPMVEKSAAAAAFVNRFKADGVIALADAGGDVAAAEQLLVKRVQVARLPSGRLVPPSHYGGGWHGTAAPPEQVFEHGMPGRGGNVDLESHVMQGPDTAFRGTTTTPLTPDGAAGAAHWAGAGGWVYEIDGMPTWDVNQLLEGQRATPGGFAGNLMSGELENVVPAEVPPARIKGARPVLEGRGTGLKLGDYQANPHYVPPGASPAPAPTPAVK
jgi:hypothetical protein